jgi:hypothetical protein
MMEFDAAVEGTPIVADIYFFKVVVKGREMQSQSHEVGIMQG